MYVRRLLFFHGYPYPCHMSYSPCRLHARPMLPSFVTYPIVICCLSDRHMLFILSSCLCRRHSLPSRRVGGTDIAARVRWSGKYHDVSGRHMAVEHGVEQTTGGQGRCNTVSMAGGRAGGGAGRAGGGQGGTTTPAGGPSPGPIAGVPGGQDRPVFGLSPGTRARVQGLGPNGVRLGPDSNDPLAFPEGGLKSYPPEAGVVPVSMEV